MRKIFILFILLSIPFSSQAFIYLVDSDIDAILNGMNFQAQMNTPKFATNLSTKFGIPKSKVNEMIYIMLMRFCEVYLLIEASNMEGMNIDTAIEIYKKNKFSSWYKILDKMGIPKDSQKMKNLKERIRANGPKKKK